MLFKGRLRLPSDPGEGIPIDLVVEDVFLSLDSDGEGFGEWRLDTVEIKRLFSNQFSMLLDGEEMVFIADDALGFAYDGLAAVEDVQSRLSKRRIFKGRKAPKRRASDEADVAEDGESEAPDRVVHRPEESLPEVVPFFPEPASPSFADSVPESSAVDESIAPVAPRPIEIADAAPPAAAAEPPPAAVEPPAALLGPPEEPTQVEPTQVESAPDQAFQPQSATEPPSFDEGYDDDLVIEDVAAYGYVPPVATPTPAALPQPPSAPVDVPGPADDGEIEIEEVHVEEAAAASGAILREAHPLADPESTPAPSRSEVHPLGDRPEPSVPEAETAETGTSEPLAEPSPIDEATPPAAEAASVPFPSDDQPSFAQWSSNGRARPRQLEEVFEEHEAPSDDHGRTDLESEPPAAQTQKQGRHARSVGKSKSTVFGRRKSREPEEHEHRYESSKTVGGITRRVCAVCGHVSFAGEDVYLDW